MKNIFGILLGTFFVLLGAGGAFGYDFGTDITIWDGRGVGSPGNPMEDNETEPGMVNTQSWDLEGFYLDGTILTMVGGFDFVNGVSGYQAYTSGDIFIDTTGNAQYGLTADTSVPFSGYDYVLDLDFSEKTYNVFTVTDGVILTDVLESYNEPYSNPWKLEYTPNTPISSGALTYTGFGELGLSNAVAVDIAFLDGKDFTAHFTMGCGNDNLMGQTAPVPEPATLLLLGSGLIGLFGFRKKFKKS